MEHWLNIRTGLAFEGANDGIWDWDIAPDALWFSSRCKSMLGYAQNELEGATISDWYNLVHEDDRQTAREFIHAYAMDIIPQPTTLRFRHKEGIIFYMMCRASVARNEHGQAQRLVGVLTDITDMVSMQEELRAERNRAQAASRAKSDFLANMSHEIRTPMNSILGLTHLLLDTPLDATQRHWVDVVRNSADGLLAIINDILDISKIEAGKLSIEQQPFHLPHTIRQALATIEPIMIQKKLELRIQMDPGVPHMVRGDAMRLRQILLNLMGNAVKFTREGYVSVSVRAEHVSTGNIRLLCDVEDSGIGIPTDKLEYIFEKFSQAEENTARMFGGTGLGLAISRKLARMMGGDVHAHSNAGKGSVFSFEIPLPVISDDERSVNDSPVLSARAALPPMKLLIAEDTLANQVYLQAVLKKLHCQSDVATNGAEALRMVRQQAYDLIFMDCQMPQMDGYEATRQIRALPLVRQPVIVAVTADAMEGDRERSLAAGMDDYLHKPVKAAQITDMLARYARAH